MTESGAFRRVRSRRVAVATAGTGAALIIATAVLVPTETIAAFADNVFAGAGFSTGTFGIESSLNKNDGYTNHSDSPLSLTVDTPISLAPGDVAYSGLFIRRSSDTNELARVTVSNPVDAGGSSTELWNEHLTFVAKAAGAVGTTQCDNSMNENLDHWDFLFDSGTFAAPERVNDASFTLGQSISGFPAGEPYIVCFEFTLDPDVVTAAPEANGQSVNPTWTFTAESVPQP